MRRFNFKKIHLAILGILAVKPVSTVYAADWDCAPKSDGSGWSCASESLKPTSTNTDRLPQESSTETTLPSAASSQGGQPAQQLPSVALQPEPISDGNQNGQQSELHEGIVALSDSDTLNPDQTISSAAEPSQSSTAIDSNEIPQSDPVTEDTDSQVAQNNRDSADMVSGTKDSQSSEPVSSQTSSRAGSSDSSVAEVNNASDQSQTVAMPSQRDLPVSRTRAKIIEDLNWVSAPKTQRNLCGGYYNARVLRAVESNVPQDEQPITITVEEASFSQTTTSRLDGNVHLSQPGREIDANTVYINRDPKTNEVIAIDSYGNVQIREPGLLAYGSHAYTNLEEDTGYFENVLYRMVRLDEEGEKQVQPLPTPMFADPVLETSPQTVGIYGTTGWGEAQTMEQLKDGIITITDGTYTTCVPTSRIWDIKASKVALDNEGGSGTLYNARLRYKGVPVFYTPYYKFPLNNDRRTGFLAPGLSHSNNSGIVTSTPFYWNIAPNYDATITPYYYSKRGFQLTGVFRLLTEKSRSSFEGGIIPYDREFASFQASAKTDYAGNDNLNNLLDSSTTRGFFTFLNQTTFNQYWSTDIEYNYVSDNYYLQDFAAQPNEATDDQLLRKWDLNFQSQHWKFLTRLQGYQTLFQVNQPGITAQYSRLPELALQGHYGQLPYGMNFAINNQFVRFEHVNEIDPTTGQDYVDGNRLNIQPSLSRSFQKSWGYIKPRVQVQGTFYDLQNPGYRATLDASGNAVPTSDKNPSNPARVLPITDIDMGLYFDRSVSLFSSTYTQTFEPRLMYLYVPYVNQDDIPVFETTLPIFRYNQLWRTNRFSGPDRVGDANQVSLGLATRFIDQETGLEKIRAGIGQIIYFENRRVNLCATGTCVGETQLESEGNQSPPNASTSPLTGEIAYQISPLWSFSTDAAYTLQNSELNNLSFNFRYQADERHIINLGYNYIRGGDVFSVNSPPAPSQYSYKNNLNQPDISAFWALNPNWAAFGRFNYNVSHGYGQTYMFGIQYESCCWGVRALYNQYYQGLNQDNSAYYTREFYVELSLTGLAAIGTGGVGGIMMEGIPGYINRFSDPRSD